MISDDAPLSDRIRYVLGKGLKIPVQYELPPVPEDKPYDEIQLQTLDVSKLISDIIAKYNYDASMRQSEINDLKTTIRTLRRMEGM